MPERLTERQREVLGSLACGPRATKKDGAVLRALEAKGLASRSADESGRTAWSVTVNGAYVLGGLDGVAASTAAFDRWIGNAFARLEALESRILPRAAS